MAKLSTILLGLGLAFAIAFAARGFKAPPIHTSSAVIKPLVPTKALKAHLYSTELAKALRADIESLPPDPVLFRRLEMGPLRRSGQVELNATAPDAAAASALLRAWLETGHRKWDGPRPSRVEPFIWVASPE